MTIYIQSKSGNYNVDELIMMFVTDLRQALNQLRDEGGYYHTGSKGTTYLPFEEIEFIRLAKEQT